MLKASTGGTEDIVMLDSFPEKAALVTMILMIIAFVTWWADYQSLLRDEILGVERRIGTMNAVTINADDLEWLDAPGYPSGTEEKVLSVGGTIAPRVTILRFPPGWKMEAHSHRFTELHYVLEGQLESEGKRYPAGTFRIIPSRVAHGPFSSETGAVVLVVWCSLAEEDV